MADDEGIGGLYRIGTVRSIGAAKVFPIRRLKRRPKAVMSEEKKGEKEKTPKSDEGEGGSVDVMV
ncbi:MAG TPA: hypothetical protein VN260_06530 [Dissulfurispiraceae bacterium]|nr:hypothetical protein [Dissulfurispiraceae bacterium]